MGIYIKGTKMPENCAACLIEDEDLETFWCTCPLLKKWDVGGARSAFTNDVRYKGRRENCPLVEVAEPHGRLIDADKLQSDITECIEVKDSNLEWEQAQGLKVALECVGEAKMVIEAEGKSDVRINQGYGDAKEL